MGADAETHTLTLGGERALVRGLHWVPPLSSGNQPEEGEGREGIVEAKGFKDIWRARTRMNQIIRALRGSLRLKQQLKGLH